MNETRKTVQYILFVLMVCSLLVLPAAGETLPGGNVSPGESTVNTTVTPEVTETETPTVIPTDEPGMRFAGTLSEDPTLLFNGTVALANGTFECTAYNSDISYTIQNRTPLGALQAVAEREGFTYDVTDKKWVAGSNEVLLLDNIGEYLFVRGGAEWACYVNGILKDGYSNLNDAVNVVALADGDTVVFCYGNDPTPEVATALIRIEVTLDESPVTPTPTPTPSGWSITLTGATTETVDQDYFEDGIDCGHVATYTDENGGEWSGMPLWYLVGLVDDGQAHGSGAFNDALAAQGYSVKIIAEDGYAINFESASVAKNDEIIVANTLNGTELPETIGEKNKLCWPLQLIGPDVSAGQKVGGIASIELVGLPEPSDEWEITLSGAFNRTLTQAEFEDGVACHGESYTDGSTQVWTGIPLWYLVAVVDDMEADDHWTLNDTRAAAGYTVRVTASDGFNATFSSADIARNDTYLVADKMNAAPLPADGDKPSWPLKLTGSALTSNKQRIGSIASITLEGLPDEITESEWTLALEGPKVADLLTREEFEACGYHTKTYNDGVSTWTGVPLKVLCGWVDDDVMHGSGAFNTALAQTGYTVLVSSGGETPYSKEFTSQEIMANPLDYIVASTVNGTPITGSAYPLRLVGEGAAGSNSVGNVQKIQLVDFQEPTEAPSVRIVRYASDGVTVLNETTKTIDWMEDNLEVYGAPNGVRLRFQGPTFDPDDLWNPEEDKNPGKVDEVVKGTSIHDLCDLVGGVPEGGEVELIASDGYEAKLNYTNLYTPLDRQGEAIVAWWTERQGYSPGYSDGPRLFFNTPDGIFGADDMRVCLAEEYWHYYWADGIQYPSAGGVSNRNIATIKIKPGAREDWNLVLTGAISDTISRSYFESGKACAMGGHGATWTDDQDQVWSGMPLWLLCGWVDDANKHSAGTDPFRDDLADAGYNVTVIDYGPDGTKGTDDDFSTTFNSSFVKRNNNIIVADEIDGAPLPADGDKPSWPLKLVGTALTSNKQKVGSIDEIVLDGVPIVVDPPTGDATISLEEGWNFVSTPKRLADGSNTFAIFFDAVDTADHSILIYDGLEQKWEDVASTELFQPLDGVWVYSNEACTVPLTFATGEPGLPPAKNLGKGWNAIGFSDTVPESAASTLLSLGEHWTTLIGYDAENQEYGISIIRGASGSHGEERTMQPTQGYWVYTTEADTLAAISA
jgi:DMSO/TMAO reductase YedYZ molybdopterin-dependent catalytic subunit